MFFHANASRGMAFKIRRGCGRGLQHVATAHDALYTLNGDTKGADSEEKINLTPLSAHGNVI